MKVLLSWLKEFVTHDFSPVELADRLSLCGLEVESLRYLGEGLEPVLIGQVAAIRSHLHADKLRVCSVEVGRGTPVEIITAATNVQQGDFVAAALAGAHLTTGLIEPRTMRGVLSNGMLCSLHELGLESKQGEGVYVLPETIKVGRETIPARDLVGRKAVEVLGLDDWLLEVAPTPNRPDCLSMLGVAREVAALARRDGVLLPEIAAPPGETESLAVPPVSLEDPNCLAYHLALVTGLAVGPSPEWLRARLHLCGFRSINNLVDVTNYVMHELGQPLHVFDREKVGRAIIVRPARPGEILTTIDGSELALDETMMLIADDRIPQALAGVMGGLSSEVSEATHTILLESACFITRSVRRTSLKVNIHSESAIRFRQGVDREMVRVAFNRALQLFHCLAAGDGFAWNATAAFHPGFKAAPLPAILLRRERLNRILGTSPPWAEVPRMLTRLGCRVEETDEHRLQAIPPSWRSEDLHREIDLIEEIARLEGYDRIPTTLPARTYPGRNADRLELAARCRNILCGLGLTEAATGTLVGGEALHLGPLTLPALPLKNPITTDLDHLRPNLALSHLAVLKDNLQQGHEALHLFEVGQVFDPSAAQLQQSERWRLAGLLYGSNRRGLWKEPPEAYQSDFFAAKGLLQALSESLGLSGWQVEPLAEPSYYHPGRAAGVRSGDQPLGTFGELHPEIAVGMGFRQRVCLFDLDFDRLQALVQARPPLLYQPPSRYPAVYRDMSLLVKAGIPAASVEEAIRSTTGPFLESIVCFDHYADPERTGGEHGLSFHLVFRSPDRTLEEKDVEAAFSAILERLEKMDIRLRG